MLKKFAFALSVLSISAIWDLAPAQAATKYFIIDLTQTQQSNDPFDSTTKGITVANSRKANNSDSIQAWDGSNNTCDGVTGYAAGNYLYSTTMLTVNNGKPAVIRGGVMFNGGATSSGGGLTNGRQFDTFSTAAGTCQHNAVQVVLMSANQLN